mgnify:CR=1 FL=1
MHGRQARSLMACMDAREQAYFQQRILEEEEAARDAGCSEARLRHEALAEAYRARCLEAAADGARVNPVGAGVRAPPT